MSLPLAACADSDNSPLEHDSELFESSKDWWSRSLHWQKTFGFGLGVFGGCRQKEGRFCFFWLGFYDVITRTMANYVAQSLVVF